MAVKLRKPILVGGIGISIALWLWDTIQQSVMEVGQLSVVGAIALGTGFWFLQRKASKKSLSPQLPLLLSRETAAQAIAQAQTMVAQLETEAPDKDICELKQQVAQLPNSLNRQELQLAISGGKKAGKTTLKEVLEHQEIAENIRFVETEALLSEAEAAETAAKEVALASDLVLMVINGDLTDSEWQILQQLRASHQHLILLFNKQDRYLPEERAAILEQLRHRVQEIISTEDVLAISASPAPVKVRQHQEDGSVQESMKPLTAEVGSLSDRLRQILSHQRQQLVWATTWREAMGLKAKAKNILNEFRRDRAVPIIEGYQWIAAAAAFANPVAALDLLATAAINAQMLVDLSDIYQQKFSLSQAQTASGTIGKLMVQLGLVELSTQTIGIILKSNALTYVAGGAVQGVSAAYLTRLAGLSLIEYFQEQEVSGATGKGLNLEKLGQKLQKVFQQNQRTAFLQNFVKQAVVRLSPESSQGGRISSQNS